ncbi:MAG: hypothetical protein QW815_08105, partial [Nitrososphaerota archaeon]
IRKHYFNAAQNPPVEISRYRVRVDISPQQREAMQQQFQAWMKARQEWEQAKRQELNKEQLEEARRKYQQAVQEFIRSRRKVLTAPRDKEGKPIATPYAQRLLELIEEHSGYKEPYGDKSVLVYSLFQDSQSYLRDLIDSRFGEGSAVIINTDTSPEERAAYKKALNHRVPVPGIRVAFERNGK